jgi:polysaccharide export outer membrane protein
MQSFEQMARLRRPLPFLLLALCGVLFLALSACASGRGGSVPYEPKGFEPPKAELDVEPTSKIAAFDKLEIKVFQVEDLSGEFQVNPAGNILFPLVGTIAAAGKTAPELAQFIASELSTKYLRSPSVQVNIMEAEATQRTITVDGSVKEPGVFPVKGPTSLMRAIAQARGVTEDANARRVIVFRSVNGQKMAGAFDLAAIRKAEAEDPLIYADDVIIVDGSRARALFRDLLSTLPIIGTIGVMRPF